MKLISWNTNARSRQVGQQVAFLKRRKPDIVALQEVTPRSIPFFRAELGDMDCRFVLDSFEEHQGKIPFDGPRRYGVLIASKFPIKKIRRKGIRVPWKEKLLSVSVEGPGPNFDLHNVYVPSGASHGWIKAETLEGIFQGLSKKVPKPRILCGDFNAPKWEFPSGETVTWAQRDSADGGVVVRKRFRNGDGARWDAAERNVMRGLAEFDLPDVFRWLHGWKKQGSSWYPIRKKGKVVGRRFDHVFASPSLHAKECRYLSKARQGGLSDHAPVEVEFSN